MSHSAAGAPEPLTEDLLARVLAPYLDGCRYVKEAAWHQVAASEDSLARLSARCAIGASCYIEETGHFNAVEANICFNQLFYLFGAEGVRRGRIPGLEALDADEWVRRQLPDVLITRYAFRFVRVIDRRDFRAELCVERINVRRQGVWFDTLCTFEDAAGGKAEGEVRLVFVRQDGASS